MRKIAILCGLTGMVIMTNFLVAGGETVLVKDGKPVAAIYIGWKQLQKPDPRLSLAERYLNQSRRQMETDLNYHLRIMSGIELKIIRTDDPAEVQAPAIVLGELAVRMGATPATSTRTREGYRIISRNNLVLIGGESDIGAMYGMYEMLERLGCDWVMPGEAGEVISKRTTIALTDIDLAAAPDFEVRCPWYSGGTATITTQEHDEFDVWKMRHKNQPSYLHNGGIHPLQMLGGHVWGAMVRLFGGEFAADQTMLALVRQPDGTMKRMGPQVETTHPAVIRLFKKYIEDMFVKNGWSKDHTVCIGVGPADGGGFSESPESTNAGSGRTDPMLGRPDITDLQILLCNTLLGSLLPEYPNLYLGFYLYSAHADFPMRYKPHPHVQIVIADITYSRFHWTGEDGISSRGYYRGILEQWGNLNRKQGNPMMYRGYNFNLAECLLPYTKLKIWGEDLPYYKKAGCIGTYSEWVKNWSVTGPGDYLEVKLNWNTSLKWRDVLTKYCKSAFGKGAPFMEQYYLNIVKQQHGAKIEAGSYHGFHLIYDKKFIADSNALFDRALQESDNPRSKRMIAWYREPLEMLELYLAYRKAFTSYDFVKANELYDEIGRLWDKYYRMNSNLVGKSALRYLKRFQEKFIREGLKYSTGEYRIAKQIPEKLVTMLDPYVKGQEMGFHSPELNDKRFIETSTWNIPWSAQGFGAYFDGAIWYRVRFDVPAALQGKPLGLFLGGVDNLARVYLNGKYIGEGRGFSAPMVFDLTGDMKYNAENLLAIQVQHADIGELGTFGIIYPSFIFTGPRLEQKAPTQQRLRRVLPGGELGDYE
jgi:hypothetical protein